MTEAGVRGAGGPRDDGLQKNGKPLTTGLLLFRGLTRRCGVCGTTKIFSSYFHMHERCPRCNFPADRRDGQRAGALGMNTIVSFGVLLVTVVVGLLLTYPDFDFTVLLPVCIGVTVLMPVLFYPVSRTLWNAIDLIMLPPEPEDDIDPAWLPPPRRPPRR